MNFKSKFLLILLILLLLNIKNNEILTDNEFYIDIPIEEHKDKNLKIIMISMEIGTPSQKLNLIFDSGSSLLVINSINTMFSFGNRFNQNESKTYQTNNQNGSIQYMSNYAKGYFSYDKISFLNSNKKIIKFDSSFLLAHDSDFSKFDGIFGIGYKNSKTGFNDFLFEMKKQNLIKKEMFSITLYNENEKVKKSYMTFGNYPELLINKLKGRKIKSCSLIKHSSHWSCSSKGISYGMNIVNVSNEGNVVIDTGAQYSYIKESIFQEIVFSFFDKYIREGKCNISQLLYSMFYCEISIINEKLKNINFHLGDFKINSKPEDYFKYDKKYNKLLFQIVGRMSDKTTFGYPALTNLISVFNREDNLFEWISLDELDNNEFKVENSQKEDNKSEDSILEMRDNNELLTDDYFEKLIENGKKENNGKFYNLLQIIYS